MTTTDDDNELEGEVLDDEIAEALALPKPRKPKYGDAGNLELWEDDEGEEPEPPTKE